MLASLPWRDSFRCGFRIVHLGRNVLPLPSRQYPRIEVHYVLCAFSDLRSVEENVMMMIVQHHGNVELLADRQNVVYVVAYIVVFQHESVLDRLRETSIHFLEPLDSCSLISKDTTHMQNHDSVSVDLVRKLEETEHLVVIVKVADCVVDD